jgi:hypothetical protein
VKVVREVLDDGLESSLAMLSHMSVPAQTVGYPRKDVGHSCASVKVAPMATDHGAVSQHRLDPSDSCDRMAQPTST